MELRAPVPYSILIWSSHIRTKVTTSRDMATPHASTAILLSHLQALYNVIILTFVIAGVAVTLLWLVREVGKDIGNVDRGEGAGRGGGSIITPKQGVAIEAWCQRGAYSNRSPTSIMHYAKSNMGPHLEPYRTVDSITDSNKPR